MNISRRDFLKWVAVSATALGLSAAKIEKVGHAMADILHTPVIWLQAAGCTGCTLAFLNMVETNEGGPPLATVDKMLTEKLDMRYHQTLMAASASEAMTKLEMDAGANAGKYILVVEGAVPTANGGAYCVIGEKNNQPWTAKQALLDLAPNAKYILAVGTCASFKGVAGAGTNATGVQSVEGILGDTFKAKIFNLPGCPVHPYIIGETLINLLTDNVPERDTLNRPKGSYSSAHLHEKVNGAKNCPLKDLPKTNQLGVCGNCFSDMGCKGRDKETRMTCYTRYWGINWEDKKGCFGTGNMCIGCSSANFPFSSIYN